MTPCWAEVLRWREPLGGAERSTGPGLSPKLLGHYDPDLGVLTVALLPGWGQLAEVPFGHRPLSITFWGDKGPPHSECDHHRRIPGWRWRVPGPGVAEALWEAALRLLDPLDVRVCWLLTDLNPVLPLSLAPLAARLGAEHVASGLLVPQGEGEWLRHAFWEEYQQQAATEALNLGHLLTDGKTPLTVWSLDGFQSATMDSNLCGLAGEWAGAPFCMSACVFTWPLFRRSFHLTQAVIHARTEAAYWPDRAKVLYTPGERASLEEVRALPPDPTLSLPRPRAWVDHFLRQGAA